MALDEASIKSVGILGIKESLLQFRLCSEQQSTIDPDHPILPALLDHLTVDADTPESSLRHPLIHLETVGGEQEAVFNTASLQGVGHYFLDVSEVTETDLDGDPESGPYFEGCHDPDHPLFGSKQMF